MDHFCQKCQARVRWSMKRCASCGKENPTGANPADVALGAIAISILALVACCYVRSFLFAAWF
jgi:hypothetical protein